jgi:hypothetical protein
MSKYNIKTRISLQLFWVDKLNADALRRLMVLSREPIQRQPQASLSEMADQIHILKLMLSLKDTLS